MRLKIGWWNYVGIFFFELVVVVVGNLVIDGVVYGVGYYDESIE